MTDVSGSRAAVHKGITCDACGENPILGTRHMCCYCDRDYCDACAKHTKKGCHPTGFVPLDAPTDNVLYSACRTVHSREWCARYGW
jgi:hypothetical protein